MATIRGRIGQFKVLRQQQQLIPHIVPTVYFTKNSLLSMFTQYNALILKPIVGRNFIKLEKQTNGFLLWQNETKYFLSNAESIMGFIIKNTPDQQYVMQPVLSSNKFWKKQYQFLLTIARKGTYWKVTSITKVAYPRFSSFLFYLHLSTIKKIALQAAKTLSSAFPNCEAIVLDMSCDLVGNIYIHDSHLHFSVSKWNQYQSLKHYMPQTTLLTNKTLKSFLQTYTTVFIKPINGQHGIGIIKITRKLNGTFEIRMGRKNWEMVGIAKTILQIHQLLSPEIDYVIQQGIPLAMIEGSVFDTRVVLQKLNNQWQVIGKAVKVAGDGFFITNAAQAILPLEDALKKSTIGTVFQSGLETRINQLCILAVHALNQHTYYEIGFDVGITNCGDIKIIEGNYRSDVSLFHQLENRTMYKNILNNRSLVNQPRE